MWPFIPLLQAFLCLPPAIWTAPDSVRRQADTEWPSRAGVYAMTAQGPVELIVNGERGGVRLALGQQLRYDPREIDRIPVADSVLSFFVRMPGWTPKDLYLVVGRERLIDPMTKYQRLAGRAITREVAAYQIIANDLEPASLAKAIGRLTPKGKTNAEAYVVLELKSTADLNDRAYPIRIAPAQHPRPD